MESLTTVKVQEAHKSKTKNITKVLLVFVWASYSFHFVLLAHFQVVSIDKIEADYEFHASTWDPLKHLWSDFAELGDE